MHSLHLCVVLGGFSPCIGRGTALRQTLPCIANIAFAYHSGLPASFGFLIPSRWSHVQPQLHVCISAFAPMHVCIAACVHVCTSACVHVGLQVCRYTNRRVHARASACVRPCSLDGFGWCAVDTCIPSFAGMWMSTSEIMLCAMHPAKSLSGAPTL